MLHPTKCFLLGWGGSAKHSIHQLLFRLPHCQIIEPMCWGQLGFEGKTLFWLASGRSLSSSVFLADSPIFVTFCCCCMFFSRCSDYFPDLLWKGVFSFQLLTWFVSDVIGHEQSRGIVAIIKNKSVVHQNEMPLLDPGCVSRGNALLKHVWPWWIGARADRLSLTKRASKDQISSEIWPKKMKKMKKHNL